MKITDVIRSVLDIVDGAEEQEQQPVAVIDIATTDAHDMSPEPQEDDLGMLMKLAGVATEPEYANEPAEIVAPLQAAFPGGDDMHQRKNPADIRTNAPSMYPGYQAGVQ